MRQLYLGIVFGVFSLTAGATPVSHPSGPNLTYGDMSNPQTVFMNITNPAAGAMHLLSEKSHYGFGVLSSAGAGLEFGQVDDLFNEVDKLQQDLENLTADDLLLGITGNFTSVDQVLAAASADLNSRIVNPLNAVMKSLDNNAYARVFSSIEVPTMPIAVAHKFFRGALVLDANIHTVFNFGVIADPLDQLELSADQNGNGQIDANELINPQVSYNIELDDNGVPLNDSTLTGKLAYVGQFSLGYSMPVWKLKNDSPYMQGDLLVGTRLSLYQVGLLRVNQRLFSLASENGQQDSNNFFDELGKKDPTEFNNTGFGVDLGVLWVAKYFRAGLTLNNLNSPSFDFNDGNFDNYDTTGAVYAELSKGATYTMGAQAKLESAVYTPSQNFVIGFGLDLNAIEDPVGDEFQWMTVSAAYATRSWLLPGARVGYRLNLAGSGLSYLSMGFTFFKMINLDIAMALEKVTIPGQDIPVFGEKVPRGVIANLGWEISF